ncbi:MAG: DUF4079 domain-containing protein [Synechococcus sp.]|nr:DUF4079 domain-containing protein [Synechococcus sp.]
MFLTIPSLTTMQWLGLVHPVLIILFVYPVVGATIRLGILARERRLELNPIAPTVPVEHADHGRWATGAVVLAVLIAMAHDVATAEMAPSGSRLLAFIAAEAGVVAAFLALLRSRRTMQRLAWALSSWFGLLLLGSQPEVTRGAYGPWQGAFWQSHYWGGIALCGLLMLTMGLQAEIGRRLAIRRLHVVLNLIVALLLATQAITGTRNLLMAVG